MSNVSKKFNTLSFEDRIEFLKKFERKAKKSGGRPRQADLEESVHTEKEAGDKKN